MTQQQAIAFIQAFNTAQPYVPPMIFQQIAQTELVQIIVRKANGQSENVVDLKEDKAI